MKTLLLIPLLLLSCQGHNVGKRKAPTPVEPQTYNLVLEGFKPVKCTLHPGGSDDGHLASTEGIQVKDDKIVSLYFNKWNNNVRFPLDVTSIEEFDASWTGDGHRFGFVETKLNGNKLDVFFSIQLSEHRIATCMLELYVGGSNVEGFETIGIVSVVNGKSVTTCTKISMRFRMMR